MDFFSQIQLSVQTYGVCTAPMCSRMHQYLYARLKIPNTGSHLIYIIIWTRENIAYADRNGYSAALAKRLSLFQLTVKMTPQLWLIWQTPLHLLRISRNVTTSLSQWSQYHILQINALAERQTESGKQKQKQSTLCRQQRRHVHIWQYINSTYIFNEQCKETSQTKISF